MSDEAPSLLVEVQRPDGTWAQAGEPLTASSLLGSMADNHPGGRDVYHFGIEGARATIRRSIGGVDAATDELRLTSTFGLELIAELWPGDSHEMTVTPSTTTMLVRFTCS